MGKFDGMLFCTDLDGTLYSNDKTVSKQNLDAIEYFKSEGGRFTFITGRVPQISGDICKIIKPNAPYGCVNGGGIYDPAENRFLWNETVPMDVIELLKYVDENMDDMGIQIDTVNAMYFNKDNKQMEHFRAKTGVPNISCPYDELNEPILKIIFGHEDEKRLFDLIKLLEEYPQSKKYSYIRAERTLYDLIPKGVSKGGLLEKMAELLGIDMKRTVAVGDYNNDVSMIQKAGIGFAVSNAVDEAKRVADHITVSNNDHAIAAIIDQFDKGVISF